MDPQATLDLAARAYREDDFEESFEALNNYFEWRRSGGFQPRGGDKRAQELLDKLVRATGGYESGWEEAEYVEGYENPGEGLVFHAKTRGGKYEIKGFEKGGKYSATEYTSGRETGRSTGHTQSTLSRHLAKTIRLAQDIDRINYRVVLDNLGTANPRRKRKTKNPEQRATNVRSLVARALSDSPAANPRGEDSITRAERRRAHMEGSTERAERRRAHMDSAEDRAERRRIMRQAMKGT